MRHLEVIERELSEQESTVSTEGASMPIREEDEEEDGGDTRQRGQQRLKMIFMREEEEVSRALMVRAAEDEDEEEEEEEDGDIGYNVVMGSKYQQDHAKRVKGYSSNQAKLIAASSANDDDDEEDLESYRYPKIRKHDSGLQHYDEDEEDEYFEEADLESQRRQSQIPHNSGRGAVGKLKALRNSKLQFISTKQPF